MSGTESSASERMQQLLEVVEQQRERRCGEIIGEAQQEARRLLKQARREARRRVHGAILHARAQYSHQLVLQQASQATRQRQIRYRVERDLLDRVWRQLREALTRRWQDAGARRTWVETLSARAEAALVRRDWRIEHPADWPADERVALARHLGERLGREPQFAVDPSLQAGIRIQAGETLVDGSCEGLLRDRVAIEARLLAGLKERQRG